MRNCFDTWADDRCLAGDERRRAKEAWQAAYAAGMERAAGICDELYGKPVHYFADECADAIRAEIKESA